MSCARLRRRPVAGELYQKAKERAVVAFEKLTQCIELTIADGEHEGMVGALFGRGFHGVKTSGRFNHGETRLREWFRGKAWLRGFGGQATVDLDFFERSNHGSGTWLMLSGRTVARLNGYEVF